jgi:FlaA1/EpsC-like NDP-sugar epimerase
MKVIIFGAGGIGRRLCEEIKAAGNDEVLCFADNNRHKQDTVVDGVRVFSPDKIFDFDYDKIIVSSSYVESMKAQLLEMGIDRRKIEAGEEPHILVRKQWLSYFSELCNIRNLGGGGYGGGSRRFPGRFRETYP